MHDPVQKKDLHDIINDIFAARARGTVSEDGLTWTWNGEPLDDALMARSQEDHVTYGDYLRHRFPVCSDPVLSNQNKLIRRQHRSHFTSPGYPGESMAVQFEAVLKQLRLPSLPSSATVQVLEGIGLGQTPYYFIIPSFFRLIQWLHTRKTSFNLIFRTFGDDLHRIALEFNAFCEGRHPFFQLIDERMDGSNGSVDRRLHVETTTSPQKSHQHGTFIRSDTSTTLVMGTFQQPSSDTLMTDEMESFYHRMGSSSLVFIHGMNAIHEFLNATSWRQAQSTLAIRDFYPHWFCHEEAVEAGKLMTIDTSDLSTHVMFLDDNIFIESPHIVDCRHYPHGTPLSYQETRDIHLLRVEPYEAIVDYDYFIKRIQFSLIQRRAFIENIKHTE